jgi:predicted restriction endonuclease
VFAEYNLNPKCVVCGYNLHVEVAHKKAVSEYDDHITIKEINSIENLIGLCPNHHWEYDNGLITL